MILSVLKFQNWGARVKTMLPEERIHTATLLLLWHGPWSVSAYLSLQRTRDNSFFSTKLTVSDPKENLTSLRILTLDLEQKNYYYSKKNPFQMMRWCQYVWKRLQRKYICDYSNQSQFVSKKLITMTLKDKAVLC